MTFNRESGSFNLTLHIKTSRQLRMHYSMAISLSISLSSSPSPPYLPHQMLLTVNRYTCCQWKDSNPETLTANWQFKYLMNRSLSSVPRKIIAKSGSLQVEACKCSCPCDVGFTASLCCHHCSSHSLSFTHGDVMDWEGYLMTHSEQFWGGFLCIEHRMESYRLVYRWMHLLLVCLSCLFLFC